MPQSHPLLVQTFSQNSNMLPTNNEVKSYIYTDRSWMDSGDFNQKKMHLTIHIRELYLQHSFALLTNDFLLALHNLCINFTQISEICAGLGWLSHWLNKYQTKTQGCIDDKSWHGFSRKKYLPHVTEMDSVNYVKTHTETDLFILCWPYTDNLAATIWQALQPGQHLLYIGELQGGCTANNNFFDLITDHQISNKQTHQLQQSFISFDDFHDKPYLFRKGN